MARRLPSSKRQYVAAFNTPAKLMASKLPDARLAAMPKFVPFMLATAIERPPSGDNWLHEIKFDGYRLQVHKSSSGIHCYTRRGHDWTARFPTLVTAARTLRCETCVLDGEAVVVDEEGRTDFNALESYVSSKSPNRSRHHLVFYAFDLLHVDSWDLMSAPFIDRKAVLAELLSEQGDTSPVRLSDHLEGDGPKVYKSACHMELEGIVSKRKDGRYHTRRSDAWVKITCRYRDTFLVAGIAYKGRKFDGVYLGRAEDGEIVYAGKVENGFSAEQVAHLEKMSARLVTTKQPFAHKVDKTKGKWLKPKLLADVEFRARTPHGLLRHPSYKGLREDL